MQNPSTSSISYAQKTGVINLDSLKKLTFSTLQKSKVKVLLVTQEEPVGPEFIITIRQFKLVYPSVKVITVLKEYSLDTVVGLTEAGVDHVIDKSLGPNLVADRIAAILNEPITNPMPRSQVGDLVIDPSKRRVIRGGKDIILRRKEFELLEFLAKNIGRVITRTELLDVVWGYKSINLSNTVDVHMASLRRKIDRGYKSKLIHTVHGKGYKLDVSNK